MTEKREPDALDWLAHRLTVFEELVNKLEDDERERTNT